MDGNLRKEIYNKVDPFRANCKRIHDDKNSAGMSFDTALMLMKEKGYSMKRQKWDDKCLFACD